MAEPLRTACAPTIAEVRVLLEGGRFDLTTEAATQAEMDRALVGAFGRDLVSREHRLGPGDRPDFLIDGEIVVEVKHKRGQSPQIVRQLKRYAAYPQVKLIFLATGRSIRCPALLNGVEVIQVNLGRAWL